MKNFIFSKRLAVLAAAVAMLTGCTESAADDSGVDGAELVTVEASASLPGDDDTRVVIGGYDSSAKSYPLAWEGTETLAVVNTSESYGTSKAAPKAVIKEYSGKSATFSVTLPAGGGDTWCAVSPYSALESSDDDFLSLNFPTTQTPTNASADPAAIMLVTEGVQFDGSSLDFTFRHIASYAKMTLKGLGVSGIKSVTFKAAGEEISGRYGYFPSDGDGLPDDGAKDYVTVNGTSLKADGDGNFTVWFSVIPFELRGKFTVTVTDTGNNSYTKECDASKNPIDFVAGRISGFTVDMTPAPKTYVVMAKYNNKYYALSSKANGARLDKVVVSDYKEGQEPYQTSNTNIIWTLVDKGNGKYYLENGGKYLYHDGNTKSSASVGTTPALLDINFTTGQIKVSSMYLTYNANSGTEFFAFYASNSTTQMVQNLLIVPANGNTGGNGGGDNNGGNNGGDDNNGDGDDNNNGGNVDPSKVYRTGWPELPVTDEYVYQTNYRRDNGNADYYYAHHLCPDVNNAQNNGKARNYTVCFSAQHHCPLWVAAPRHSSYNGSAKRSDAYKADPNIPSNLQYTSQTTGSSCNKGHMLGSAERTVTTATNAQVFYYSNIAPQETSTFNTGGGAWNNLEDWVDKKVCADTTYVVIGAYFDNYTDKLRGYNAAAKKISYCGRSDVSWPTMFYYVLLRTKKGNTGKSVQNCSKDEIMCAAFVRSHNCAKGTAVSRQDMMSVAELEKLTGFVYFPNVPNAPKDSFNASDWGL